jgi:hypothetical protein
VLSGAAPVDIGLHTDACGPHNDSRPIWASNHGRKRPRPSRDAITNAQPNPRKMMAHTLNSTQP